MIVVVIGGGAAGFFAAIHAAEKGAEVILLEKTAKVLSKVKVSGGGRCNVTNSCIDPVLLAGAYPRGGKELRGPFSKFSTVDTMNWFVSKGVELKTEPDGRVFPVTNNSQTIIDCLCREADILKVKIYRQFHVQKISRSDNGFKLESANSSVYADKIIIASGGHPMESAYHWLKEWGESIVTPVPSLFTFNIPESPFLDLMGVSVPEVRLKLEGTKLTETGPLLFTHWGISGPAVIRLSAWAARILFDNKYQFHMNINFVPHLNENEVRNVLNSAIQNESRSRIYSSKIYELPVRLWEKLCLQAGIHETQKWNEAGKSSINKLINGITATSLQVKGKTTFKEEFVTCGGVDLKGVNMQTMESKVNPGIYFAGEILNIDGITGGFNFQAAWTTGYIAGMSAAESSN